MTDSELLARELDDHARKMLRLNSTQKAAIDWMKEAFCLLEKASDNLKKPRIFSVPSYYGGTPTFMVDAPKKLALPPEGFKPLPPIWFAGKTVEYGDKYKNRAWTKKDTRQLERERKLK